MKIETRMTPYMQSIWNRCVRRYQLRIQLDNSEHRVLSRDRTNEPPSGRKNYRMQIVRHVLFYDRALDYIDFQTQRITRRFYRGSMVEEIIEGVREHFTVNGNGTIRRMYKHNGRVDPVVRTFSLRNYYLIEDEQIAQLIMVNNADAAWIHSIPVMYYPISNDQLKRITSTDAFYAHLAGQEAQIPKRLRHALSERELIILLQLVPSTHLNPIAAAVKHDREFGKRPATAERVLVSYYKQLLEDGRTLRYHTIGSYITSCRSLGRKVNLRIKSANRLLQERDVLTREREIDRIPDIRTGEKFILRETHFPEVKLELINSRSRLHKEARQMGSCVATYGRSINLDQCALYHVGYRGRHYTLELEINEKGTLFCGQVLGKGNAPAPARLRNLLANYVHQARPRCARG